MNPTKIALAILGSLVGGCVLLGAVGFVLVKAQLAGALPLLLVLVLLYGWMLFAFFHYRQGRQDEFLDLVTTATEAQAPLAPVLWAYVRDRPQGLEREFWVAMLQFFVLPGYYWIWHRRHSFDAKVIQVAYQLEMGASLHQALLTAPGVASPDTLLSVTIGQATGRLAQCLRRSPRGGFASVWLEILPRLLYPLALLCFLTGVVTFWMLFVYPRVQKIFTEFRADLPALTQQVAGTWTETLNFVGLNWEAVTYLLFGVVGLMILVLVSPTIRWYLPGFAHYYRQSVRCRVLRMLATALEAGKPVPEALSLLIDSGSLSLMGRQLLQRARLLVEQGEPLSASLYASGLLSRNMLPLVQAAERLHNLPWVLTELGETLMSRTVRRLRRLSLAISPLLILAVGTLVGFTVLGMFMPLLELLTRLSE